MGSLLGLVGLLGGASGRDRRVSSLSRNRARARDIDTNVADETARSTAGHLLWAEHVPAHSIDPYRNERSQPSIASATRGSVSNNRLAPVRGSESPGGGVLSRVAGEDYEPCRKALEAR